jgi:hypothetical protein
MFTFEKHRGREQELTYHAGYKLGYFSGQVSILETAVDDITYLQAQNSTLVERVSYLENLVDKYKQLHEDTMKQLKVFL